MFFPDKVTLTLYRYFATLQVAHLGRMQLWVAKSGDLPNRFCVTPVDKFALSNFFKADLSSENLARFRGRKRIGTVYAKKKSRL